MWSTYLGCYQEHPSGFQMLGRVLRVTAFTLDKWNVCIQETKQILHSSLTIAVSMTQQLRSCRVHSGQATGSSADEPQTHTAQGAGCRNHELSGGSKLGSSVCVPAERAALFVLAEF